MIVSVINQARKSAARVFLLAIFATAMASTARADLQDNGGPVMRDTIHAFFIYWTPTGVVLDNALPDGVGNFQSLEQRFFDDVANTDYMNIATQYPGHCSGIRCVLSNDSSSVAFGGSWVDTQAYPTHGIGSTAGTQTNPLSDADIQAEVSRAIDQNHWTADANAIFFVVTGVFSSSGNPVEECDGLNCTFKGVAFCAYHRAFGSTPTLYSYLSDASFMRGGCAEGLPGAVNGQISSDREIAMMTHEFMESVTDPQGNAWREGNSEIGDLCNQISATVTFDNGHQYAVQKEWSNASSSCVAALREPEPGPGPSCNCQGPAECCVRCQGGQWVGHFCVHPK